MAKTKLIAEPGKLEISFTCTFEAPRARVFKACTDPHLIPHWWGPKELTTTVNRMDLKPGGIWRFIQQDSVGNLYAFHGVYHQITPPERLVYTFEFEGTPGHVLLETVTFEEQGGMTLLTDRSVFQSVEDRDGMLSDGMESGVTESMERLEELLLKSRKEIVSGAFG